MNVERGPRKERGFVILDNALAQNSTLSFGARGLAAYLLSMPPGARADIRSLAARNPEGRSAIAGYLRELEESRYLVRTSDRGERGRFVTTCTIYEEPQDPRTLPPSLPKPWSKAKSQVPDVASQSTDVGTFSQVGPNPGFPDFGQPDFGAPGPGRPESGGAGVNPLKEPQERTSSSPQPPEGDAGGAGEPDGGGGGGDAPQQENDHRAAAFVDALPYRGRIPGPKARAHLVVRVAEALEAGWVEQDLLRQLTADTSTAKSMAAVFRYRLEPENLPEPVVVPAQRTVVPLRPRCPECERPLATGSEAVVCRDCQDDAAG